MASAEQDPIFLVLLDLSKAYDNLDYGRLLQTLAGYGAGPKLWGLLAIFWSFQEVVTFHNRLLGPKLSATIVTKKW